MLMSVQSVRASGAHMCLCACCACQSCGFQRYRFLRKSAKCLLSFVVCPYQVRDLDRYLEQMGVTDAAQRQRLAKGATPYNEEEEGGAASRIVAAALPGADGGAPPAPPAPLTATALALPINAAAAAVAAAAAASSRTRGAAPAGRSIPVGMSRERDASLNPMFVVLDAQRGLGEELQAMVAALRHPVYALVLPSPAHLVQIRTLEALAAVMCTAIKVK